MRKAAERYVPLMPVALWREVQGESWGSLRELLGGLGVVLGGLGALLGGLGALLGGSWGCLGWSWSALGATLGAVQFSIVFWMDFCRFLAPSWAPKGSQNGAQDDQKSIKNRL